MRKQMQMESNYPTRAKVWRPDKQLRKRLIQILLPSATAISIDMTSGKIRIRYPDDSLDVFEEKTDE